MDQPQPQPRYSRRYKCGHCGFTSRMNNKRNKQPTFLCPLCGETVALRPIDPKTNAPAPHEK